MLCVPLKPLEFSEAPLSKQLLFFNISCTVSRQKRLTMSTKHHCALPVWFDFHWFSTCSTVWFLFPSNGLIWTSAWFPGKPFNSKLNPHIVNTLDDLWSPAVSCGLHDVAASYHVYFPLPSFATQQQVPRFQGSRAPGFRFRSGRANRKRRTDWNPTHRVLASFVIWVTLKQSVSCGASIPLRLQGDKTCWSWLIWVKTCVFLRTGRLHWSFDNTKWSESLQVASLQQ